jgi:hypothetical protein
MYNKKKILFIAANPNAPLESQINWMTEYKLMDSILNKGRLQNQVELKPNFDTTPEEFLDYVQGNNIWLLHFCGHGNKNGKMILQDINDDAFAVRNRDFLEIIRDVAGLQCIFFNACNSHILAEETQEIIDYSIGFDGIIHNEDAIEFVKNFYESLSKVETIPMAFRLAKQRMIFKKSKKVNVVFKCKNSILMAAIISGKKLKLEDNYAQSARLQEEYNRVNADIKTIRLLRQSTQPQLDAETIKYDALFWEVLEESPSPNYAGVVWFNDRRADLAYEIAPLVMPNGTSINHQHLGEDLVSLFEYLRVSLASVEVKFTQRDIKRVKLTFDKKYYIAAFDRLAEQVPPIHTGEFLPFFRDNIEYIKSLL